MSELTIEYNGEGKIYAMNNKDVTSVEEYFSHYGNEKSNIYLFGSKFLLSINSVQCVGLSPTRS